jgi:hypothetical protein
MRQMCASLRATRRAANNTKANTLRHGMARQKKKGEKHHIVFLVNKNMAKNRPWAANIQ